MQSNYWYYTKVVQFLFMCLFNLKANVGFEVLSVSLTNVSYRPFHYRLIQYPRSKNCRTRLNKAFSLIKTFKRLLSESLTFPNGNWRVGRANFYNCHRSTNNNRNRCARVAFNQTRGVWYFRNAAKAFSFTLTRAFVLFVLRVETRACDHLPLRSGNRICSGLTPCKVF